MYVDEVGNPDLESSDNPNHRYLSLTGVVCDLAHVDECIHPEIESLKKKHFRPHPDEPVIFHRKEMLGATGDFSELKDPAVRAAFDAELLMLLQKWSFTIITVCIDKKAHRDAYTVWRFDPYHYCLAVLLERYVLFLRRINSTGDVMAESRGGKEDLRLKDSFEGIWKNGTEFIPADIFQKHLTSRQLKVKPKSANVSGLQLADLLAHPSRMEILVDHNIIKRDVPDFGRKIIAILKDKYDAEQGRCFGKKFIQ